MNYPKVVFSAPGHSTYIAKICVGLNSIYLNNCIVNLNT